MKAVNLIPAEQRRGTGGGGRTGGGAYALLGLLALGVATVLAAVLLGNGVREREGRLAGVRAQVSQAEAEAAALRPYRQFASLREQRDQTIGMLAASRFDWARAMGKVARALPPDIWLTSLTGTVSPAIKVDGGTQGSPLRPALAAPAVEMLGCAPDQAAVSRLMVSLRTIQAVSRVALDTSAKGEASGSPTGASAGGGGSGDCRHGSRRFPQFSLVVFFGGLDVNGPGLPPAGAAKPTAASPGAPGASTPKATS